MVMKLDDSLAIGILVAYIEVDQLQPVTEALKKLDNSDIN